MHFFNVVVKGIFLSELEKESIMCLALPFENQTLTFRGKDNKTWAISDGGAELPRRRYKTCVSW